MNSLKFVFDNCGFIRLLQLSTEFRLNVLLNYECSIRYDSRVLKAFEKWDRFLRTSAETHAALTLKRISRKVIVSSVHLTLNLKLKPAQLLCHYLKMLSC